MVQADLKEQPHGHPGAEICTQCCWWRPCRSSGIACQSQFKLLFCVVNYWRVTTPLLQELGGNATLIFYGTEEAKEGKNAYMERRRPDFSKFPRKPWVSVWFCNDPFNCFIECFSPTWKSEKVWSKNNNASRLVVCISLSFTTCEAMDDGTIFFVNLFAYMRKM